MIARPEKIISGGQTGADMGALLAARELGIPTGGVAPKGWLTENGPQEELLRNFGLIECEEDVRDLSITLLDRQVRHINRIVSDLLDISRIGQGKLQLTMELLDLSIITRETTEDFCRSLRKDLTVSLEAPASPLWVRGDRTRIAQMLTNLLQNAAKFTNSGGRVMVGLRPDQLQKRVVISVADTGMGIEPELLQRLFSVYTQGDRTLKRTEGGLGLGLAIVKSLAELHDGTVEVFSAGKGRGSEFRVSMPLSETPEVNTTTLRETTLLASKHSQRHGSKKI